MEQSTTENHGQWSKVSIDEDTLRDYFTEGVYLP